MSTPINTTPSTTWLKTYGYAMVNADHTKRSTVMLDFVNILLKDHMIHDRDVAWVLCAEVYANALVMDELAKFVDNLGKGKTVSL